MPVFTIYALGTQDKLDSSPDRKNILNSFANFTDPVPVKAGEAVEDEKGNRSLVINGPDMSGTEVTPNANLIAKEMYNWLVKKWLGEPVTEPINVNLACFSRGSVTGEEALNKLSKLLKNKPLDIPEDKLASFKHNLAQTHFLLYANDPVSGMGDKAMPHRIIIPEITVKFQQKNQTVLSEPLPLDHIATLQEDEMRRIFKPQDKTRRIVENFSSTTSIMLPFYGNHSDAMKYKEDNTSDCVIINYNLMYRALSAHGTKFRDPNSNNEDKDIIPPLYGRVSKLKNSQNPDILKVAEDKKIKKIRKTQRQGKNKITTESIKELPSGYGKIYLTPQTDQQLLEHFARAKVNRDAYARSGSKFSLVDNIPFVAKARRTFTEELEYYVDNSDFFMNQFERELFKKEYPNVFNFLFENALKSDGSSSKPDEQQGIMLAYQKNIAKLEKNNPAVFRHLQKWLDDNPQLEHIILLNDLQTPLGYNKLETNVLTAAVNGKKHKPDFYSLQLELLENEVIQSTLRYQREKEEYMIFFERAHFDEASEIRTQIKIIGISKGTSEEKYKKALDYLNERFEDMHQKGSQSELMDRLYHILIDHGYQYNFQEKSGVLQMIGLGVGNVINYVGKFFIAIDNILSSIVGLPGKIIEDVGKRMSDFNIPLVGDITEAIGWGIRKGLGIPAVFGFIGKGIQFVGKQIIKQTGHYQSEVTERKLRVESVSLTEKFAVTKQQAKDGIQQKLQEEQKHVLTANNEVKPNQEVQQKEIVAPVKHSASNSNELTYEQVQSPTIKVEDDEGDGDSKKPHM